jgi:hypothetical protein
MRAFRIGAMSLTGWLLVTVATYAQRPQEHLTTQTIAIGEYQVTLSLPDGWTLHEDGISFSDDDRSDCHIHFVAVRADLQLHASFEQRVAIKMNEDRTQALGDIGSKLSHAGGPHGVKAVSVRYAARNGRSIEKWYFDLPSPDADTLLEWVLDAPANAVSPVSDAPLAQVLDPMRRHDRRDCATRFTTMAGSARIRPQPASPPVAPSN